MQYKYVGEVAEESRRIVKQQQEEKPVQPVGRITRNLTDKC
jgi:hypothetical protein